MYIFLWDEIIDCKNKTNCVQDNMNHLVNV